MSKPDTEEPPEIVILVNGKLAYTVDQAAAEHGVKRRSMNSLIEREGVPVAAMLDGKKAVFFADDIQAAKDRRPGRDWRKGKGYKPGEPS